MKLQRAINNSIRLKQRVITKHQFNGRTTKEQLLLVDGVAVGTKYFHYTKGLRTRTR